MVRDFHVTLTDSSGIAKYLTFILFEGFLMGVFDDNSEHV